MTASVIAYIGMTHLGLCSAVAAASKGFEVRGFDRDTALVARLSQGRWPVVEPGLDDLVAANRSRLTFVSDATELAGCDLIYVAPDVPTDERGGSDLAELDQLVELALDASRPGSVVVILSQVPPGYTRARQRP
ncbi:MAG: GDP-mannose dehydrogenase, partial [Xanthobacteraceae bacterium]